VARCRSCGKTWPEGYRLCPHDGSALDPSVRQATAAHARKAAAAVASAPAVAPAGGELPAGTSVGEYTIVGRLADGGMGTIYAARHPVIGKKAAIKVISSELCTDPAAVERFVQEARAVNQIGHPNIVDVFAFGTLPDGRSYFVMELLQGESLAARLRRGRIPVGDAMEIIEQLCRGLRAAHTKGIIHRDLKPDNVFLVAVPGDRPLVKLLDFGIAKLRDADEGQILSTHAGTLMGTPIYMSPEQARGRHVDDRTDIYALGVMAYEMILTLPPFLSDNPMDVIAMHLNQEPPPPRSLWTEIPEPLAQLLLRMLDKDPDARPALPEIRAAFSVLRTTLGHTGRGRIPARAAVATATAPSGFAPTPTPAPEPALARGLRGTHGAALLGAAVALGIVAVLTALRGREHAPAAAPRSVVAPASAPLPIVVSLPARRVITVRVNVPDARIELDGRMVAQAADSARIPVEREGAHEVAVSAPARRPYRKIVTVVGADVELSVKLARAGRAAVAAKPVAPPPPAPAPAKTKAQPSTTQSRDLFIDPFGDKP